MDPISGADRIAAILRQRLLDRARKDAGGGASTRPTTGTGIDTVQAARPVGPGHDRGRRRSLIESILTRELGYSINDAGFQQLIDQVLQAIERDKAAGDLLGQALEASPYAR